LEDRAIKLPVKLGLLFLLLFNGVMVSVVPAGTCLADSADDAAFIITGWDSLVEETDGAKKITINLTLANTGELPGEHELVFSVNEAVEESRNISLAPGAESEVSFTTTCAQVGKYAIDVNGFGLHVEVFPPKKDPVTPVPDPLLGQIAQWLKGHWVPVAGVVAGLILLVVLAAVIIGRLYHVVLTIIRR